MIIKKRQKTEVFSLLISAILLITMTSLAPLEKCELRTHSVEKSKELLINLRDKLPSLDKLIAKNDSILATVIRVDTFSFRQLSAGLNYYTNHKPLSSIDNHLFWENINGLSEKRIWQSHIETNVKTTDDIPVILLIVKKNEPTFIYYGSIDCTKEIVIGDGSMLFSVIEEIGFPGIPRSPLDKG